MFTRTHTPVRVTADDLPPVVMPSPDSGLPLLIEPRALHRTEGIVIAAQETTMVAPGYFMPEFTFIPLLPCGHSRCSGVKIGVCLN